MIMDTSSGKRRAGQMPTTPTDDRPQRPFLYLAPLQGVTDALFRTVFHHHFGGFDAAIAPFINPQRHSGFKEKWLADVFPENNPGLPIIPQLLNTNAEDFLAVADRLQDLGIPISTGIWVVRYPWWPEKKGAPDSSPIRR